MQFTNIDLISYSNQRKHHTLSDISLLSYLCLCRPGLTGNVATGLLTMIPFGLLNDSGTNSTLNEIKIYLHQLLFFALRNPFPSIAKSLNL